MIHSAGVVFKDTRPGEADETRIPEDGFADHYLMDAGTKRKSSFLVVDADRYLRRGEVKEAWVHREQTPRGVDEKIKHLARYFDDPPIADDKIGVTLDVRNRNFAESKTVAGVTFQETRTGKLTESDIPNDDYEQHYLYPADTKSDSSYPVVDGEGYLRRGNVEAAHGLGGRGGVDGDELDNRLEKLGREFDDNPIPKEEQDSMLEIEQELAMSAETSADMDYLEEHFDEQFNEFGVRENYSDDKLESVDVVFEAMEPGPPEDRNGVRITKDFLQRVADKDYSSPNQPPHLVNHEKENSFSKIGDVRDVWFDERRGGRGKLMLMARVPNTGTDTHAEAINRYTHNPPSWREGSVSYGTNYTAKENDQGEPELVDAELVEFSAVNFPGGYDEGGIRAAFAEAAQEAVEPEMEEEPETEFEVQSTTLTFETDGEEMMMEVDEEERDSVYSQWKSLVNMSEQEMEMWDSHPCADHGMKSSENWRDNTQMLMGQPKQRWDRESVMIAHRVIDYLMEQMENMPEEPAMGGPGTCPHPMVITMLNMGHNPMESFPTGNPQMDNDVAVSELSINFSEHTMEYEYSVGDWVYRDWQGGRVNGKVKDRTKESFTVDGNTISGDDGEPVYKMEQYEDGEATGQMVAAPQSGVHSWDGPSDS